MMSLQRGKPMKSELPPLAQLVLPMLIESAKEMLDGDRDAIGPIGMVGLVLELCRKIYGKLWKRNKVGLAVLLEKTGWMGMPVTRMSYSLAGSS